MAKKTAVLVIFILSLISLLSFNVFSVTENFIALSDYAQIDACQCSIVENVIKIGNTGNINSLYSIKQDGRAAKWSVIRPKSFSLEENGLKNLTNPINVPCDAKPGSYSLNTYIETGFGLQKVIQQSVVVHKCEVKEETAAPEKSAEEAPEEKVKEEEVKEELVDTLDNIKVSVPKIRELCGCENKTYSYDITLKSREADIVKVYIEGIGWASVNSSAQNMDANSELTLDLILEPSCEEAGNKSLKIIAESLNSSKKEEHIIKFDLSREGECKGNSLLVNVLKWVAYISAGIVLIIIIVIIVLYASEAGEEPELEEPEKKPKKEVKSVKPVKVNKNTKKQVKKKTVKKKRK